MLGYDGTVVITEELFSPPSSEIIKHFLRLRELGVEIAIASGRGGSLGEDLRQIFDVEAQKGILIGYYNGTYLRSLDVNFDLHRPEGSWTLFGYEHTGPDALRRILATLVPPANEGVQFASDCLRLDT